MPILNRSRDLPDLRWGSAIVAALALLAWNPGTLAPASGPLDEDRPHPEQIRLLEELALWAGEPRVGGQPEWDPLDPFPEDPSLADSVSRRQGSFAVFVETDHSMSQELLLGLPYGGEIERAARRHRIDALLVAAIVEAESAFNPAAVSPSGALGLMQLMPETAHELGAANMVDPAQNVEAGARYLGHLLRRFDGDLPLALAAYNAGPAAVVRYGGIPPYRETVRYVERVLRRYVDHRQTVWRAATVGGMLGGY